MEYTFQTATVDEIRVPIRILSFLIFTAFALLLFYSLAAIPVVKGDPITDNLFGDITVIREPVQVIEIEEGFIPVGEAHTFVYYLEKGHKYHIYLSGEWADPNTHETDYDIYVYRLIGTAANLISTHTESAGLIEQVWNDGRGQFFIPSSTRLYYFTIRNDAIESSAAEPATLMIIEHIEKNKWFNRWMEGKVDEVPVADTLWSYEFITSAAKIMVFLDVPESLDMYEARLYVMGNPVVGKGELIEGIPVAWEPGLRSKLSGFYGGFNFDPQGFRHIDAMASCERNGEDMLIEYEAPIEGELLYHLVLIAEYGVGDLNFMVQTDLEPPEIQVKDPPEIVSSRDDVKLELFINDETDLVDVSGRYTEDAGKNWKQLKLNLEDPGNYSVMIYDKAPGITIEYVFEAEDVMGNKDEIRGSYYTMGFSELELYLSDDDIIAGDEISIRGELIPIGENVNIFFFQGEEIYNLTLTTDENGLFNQGFKPTNLGVWRVYAEFSGNEAFYNATSEILNFTVSSIPTTTTCEVSDSSIESGFGVTLSGAFSFEIPDVPVELIVNSKEKAEKMYAKTTANGSYTITFEPDSKGVWSFQARTFGDGFLYDGSESDWVELEVVTPKLITTVKRLPSLIMAKGGQFLKPPYIYGVLGLVSIFGGGIVFYLRRRE